MDFAAGMAAAIAAAAVLADLVAAPVGSAAVVADLVAADAGKWLAATTTPGRIERAG
jgi:hypothetical protein